MGAFMGALMGEECTGDGVLRHPTGDCLLATLEHMHHEKMLVIWSVLARLFGRTVDWLLRLFPGTSKKW